MTTTLYATKRTPTKKTGKTLIIKKRNYFKGNGRKKIKSLA